jgi:Zn-dependent peptidase ImmA (M78 family)
MAPRVKSSSAVTRRAAEVLKRFDVDGPPVALESICRAEGIAVCARPFDYVAGVFINDDVFPVIVVNSRERRARQRFTIAHELGHYFLGHRRKSFAEPATDNRQERDAQRFAACLLMPAAWVRQYWRAYNANVENRLSILAALFDVSRAALELRVKELGLGGRVREKR